MTDATIEKIKAERRRQQILWGDKENNFANIAPERCLAILVEEVGELAEALLHNAAREVELELVHVAAVAARWLDERFS